jgi:thiosulfate reductase cytochrome b subunit
MADPRHSATVRLTHWIATLCFFALLLSGIEIVISHPRFYWGEAGNSLSPPLFKIPIPASRSTVPTGYNYTLPDQNGWSRSLHFQSAWLAVFIGIVYGLYGLLSSHFRKNLVPDLTRQSISQSISSHLSFEASPAGDYNVLQRISYLFVIFILSPLVVWTGLAMSPAFVSAFPLTVTSLGGQQSARTIHFFVTILFVLFLLVHLGMIVLTGFTSRMRAMITGRAQEHIGEYV